MVWPALAVAAVGVGMQAGGGALQRDGLKDREDAYGRAIGGFRDEVGRIGTEEMAAARTRMNEYGVLASGYRKAMAEAISKRTEQSQSFQSNLQAAMGGMQGAEQSVFGMSGVGAPSGDATWMGQRTQESDTRAGANRGLAAAMSLDPTHAMNQTERSTGISTAVSGLSRTAGQVEQRGMLGRALRNQESFEATREYQDEMESAGNVGSNRIAGGGMLSQAGGMLTGGAIGGMF